MLIKTMKIILTGCVIFLCILCYGQRLSCFPFETRLKGTWQWTNKNDTFTVKLNYLDTIVKSHVNSDIFKSIIYGWHQYSQNGSVVESDLHNAAENSTKTASIWGTIMNNNNPIILFKDITRDRKFKIDIEFLDSTFRVFKWTQIGKLERLFYPSPNPKIWEGQTVPSPLIMHKISE
jgi:hypothetical protein